MNKDEAAKTVEKVQQYKDLFESKPVAFISWALVTKDVLERCKDAGSRLRPSEWCCGDIPLVMDVVAPFGGSEAVMKQLQEREFVGKDVMVFARDKENDVAGLVKVKAK